MPVNFTDTLVVGISSRALFDLEEENALFQKEGIAAYREYQRKMEDTLLKKGTAFHLVEALLNLNKLSSTHRLVEVIVMSRNSPETGVRLLNSLKEYGLDITRSAFTGGEPLYKYMEGFEVDLFLSKDEDDVQKVIDSRAAAAALIYDPPKDFVPETSTVRIAFDGDAVLFSDESEHIYKTKGIAAFHENESTNADVPLAEGPYAKLLKMLSKIQHKMDTGIEMSPLRIAIINSPKQPISYESHKHVKKVGCVCGRSVFPGRYI